MSTLNQTYKELGTPYFKDVFELIDQVMKEHQLPYYLIGVSAIALKLLQKGIKPSRGTKDIDFAVMISSIHDFNQIVESLENRGFEKVKAPWTFYAKQWKVAVDILPFGEIEQNDTVWFNERYSDLHVLGFKEVMENSEIQLIEEKIVHIPPLPGMILLKLVAWSDRPEERDNDLADILLIIKHYFDINSDLIYDHYFHIFPNEDEPFDELRIAAEVLGMEARRFLQKSKNLEKRILNVLERNLSDILQSRISREWARREGWELEKSFGILLAFSKGISQIK